MIAAPWRGRTLHDPESSLAGAGHRAIMAGSALRLAPRRDRASRAIRSALATAALGRHPADEVAWMARIEERRRQLVADETVVRAGVRDRSDAAPDESEEPSVPVSTAALWMSLPQVWCGFMMHLARELEPRSCVELGTAFGISGAYTAAALELNGAGTLTTLDRAGGLAGIAEAGFDALGLAERVDLVLGPIDATLRAALEGRPPVDYALLDADHTEEATVRHFEAVLPFLAPGAVVVIDDITWGDGGMRRAWRRIGASDRVTAAIGMRKLGVVVIS